MKIRKLYTIIEHISAPASSKLDPFKSIRRSAVLLQKHLKSVVDKYPHLFQLFNRYDDPASAVNGWMFQLNTLGFFANILIESTNLILSPDVRYFREGPSSNFTTYVLDIYTQLSGYSKLLDNDNGRHIDLVLTNFEERFKKMYMFENYSLDRYDEVRDLMSMSHSLVASLSIKKENISRKAYFRLQVNNMYQTTLLVEVCELTDGGIGIFKIDSGELPTTIGTAHNLIERLVRGEYSLLHMGKSLLFPIIKKGELEIVRGVRAGYELRTITGNGTELKLRSVDPVQWETYWKFAFQKLFHSNMILGGAIPSDTERIQRMPSSSDLSFTKKHDKLGTNPFTSEDSDGNKVIGLGIGIGQESDREKSPADADTTISRNSSGFSLHKSTPLQKPMDTYIKKEESTNTNPFREPFFTSNDKLGDTVADNSTYNSSTKTNGDQKSGNSDLTQSMQSMALENNENNNDNLPELTKLTETVDKESGNTHANSVMTGTIDPSSIVITNKTGIIDDGSENDTSVKDRVHDTNVHDDQSSISEFERDIHEFVRTHKAPIFKDLECNVSYWNGSTWEVIQDDEPLQLTIIALREKVPMLIYSLVDDILNPIFAVSLRNSCRSGAATARDIQLRVTRASYVVELPIYSSTLNFRSVKSKELLAILQDCIALGENTYGKYFSGSTASSSVLSNTDILSGTPPNSVLASKIKVKLHVLKDGLWRPSNIGLLTIRTESDEKGSGFLFEYSTTEGKNVTIDSRLEKVRRLGRTGLAFTSDDRGCLFEFTNQDMTDDVSRFIGL